MATIKRRYEAGRLSPFQVIVFTNGKQYSKFFRTEEEQEKYVNAIYPYLQDDVSLIFKLEPQTIREILQIEHERESVSFGEIWRFWQQHHKTREVITVWNACDSYIRMLKKADRNPEYVKHARKILERFCETYADEILTNIDRATLESWLNHLPYGQITKKNHRSTISASWEFFEQQNWVDKNIARKLNIGDILRSEIGILKVDEVERLFRANENVDPEVCGLMALGIFAGMRTSAVARVEYNEIDFEAKGILTPAEKTKKKRRDYIENLPDNLWAWLERTPQSAFGWGERKWKARKEDALRRAGLLVNSCDVKKAATKGIKLQKKIPPKNSFRHSFASYM